VRLGDFSESIRQPLEWYQDAVAALRAELARPLQVRIYSDGDASELAALLSMPGVEFTPGRSSVTDMLELSQASAIVASSSTFSMWAAFLDRVPSVWYPGRMWQRPTDDPDFHIEWRSGETFSAGFVSACVNKMERRQLPLADS
jgi:hypothetical protein